MLNWVLLTRSVIRTCILVQYVTALHNRSHLSVLYSNGANVCFYFKIIYVQPNSNYPDIAYPWLSFCINVYELKLILIITFVITDEEIIRNFLSKCKLRHSKFHARDKSESHGSIGGNSLLQVAGRPLGQLSKKIEDSNTHAVVPRSECYPCTFVTRYEFSESHTCTFIKFNTINLWVYRVVSKSKRYAIYYISSTCIKFLVENLYCISVYIYYYSNCLL